MAHTNINQATDQQLSQGIEAMALYLDPCLTMAEIQERIAHCTRDELLTMAQELEDRVVALGEAWQAEHRGAA